MATSAASEHAETAMSPMAYRPRGARLTTILLVARLTTHGRDDLCRVRDISAGGMRIETLVPLAVGQDVDAEFKNGASIHAQVAWIGFGEAGLRFDAPIEIERVLAHSGMASTARAQRPRGPRLSARCPVALRCGGRLFPGILEDISQGGARVRLSAPTAIDGPVVLITPGLGSIRATIRRQTADMIGVAFVDKLGFADLSQWLASDQRFCADGV